MRSILVIDEPDWHIEERTRSRFSNGARYWQKAGMKGVFTRTGRGKLRLDLCCEIEETDRGKSQIVITEIPRVNKARLDRKRWLRKRK